MVIGHDQHYYGLLLFIMTIILLLDMIRAFRDISKWIQGVFIVVISGFGIFDFIGTLRLVFWEKDIVILAYLCSNNVL